MSIHRFAISSIFFVNGFLLAQWVSRIPAITQELALSNAQLGTALLGMATGSLVAFPISGYLINRFGSRLTTLGFGLFFTLSLSLLAVAPNFALLTLVLALFGAGNGGMDIAMNAQGVEVEHHVGIPILNSLHGFFSLGGFIGAGAGGLLASIGVSPEPHFIAVSGVAFGVILLLSRFLITDAVTYTEPVSAAAFALPPKALWGLGAVAFCAAVGEGAMADWSALYLERSLQTSVGFAALGYASFSLAMLIGRFAGDALVRRFGNQRIVRIGSVIATSGLIAGLVVQVPWAALAGFGAVGLGLSVVAPLVFGAAGNHPDIPRGRAVAAVATMGYTGFLCGPPLLGLVAEASSLTVALSLVAVLSGLIFVLAFSTERDTVLAEA